MQRSGAPEGTPLQIFAEAGLKPASNRRNRMQRSGAPEGMPLQDICRSGFLNPLATGESDATFGALKVRPYRIFAGAGLNLPLQAKSDATFGRT
jgi:hypothetical protein